MKTQRPFPKSEPPLRPDDPIAAPLDAFASLLDRTHGRVLLAFDFDGTIAGFRADPKRVGLSAEWRRLILDLTNRYEVAIVSGRGLPDLRRKMRGLPVHLAGSHGFEIESRDGRPLSRGRAVWARASTGWTRKLQAEIDRDRALRGAWIEDKIYSCTVHFRAARDPALAERLLVRACAKLKPRPRLIAGIFVLNLVAPIAPHKGKALRRLQRATRQAASFFAGDDVTDEDVFRLPPRNLLTVRVGDNGRPTAAQFRLPHKAALRKLLARAALMPRD